MEKPTEIRKGIKRYKGEGFKYDKLAWILCKPKLPSRQSQLRSCIGTNYMLQGEPFVVYEELTLPTPEPIERQFCKFFLSKDLTKDLKSNGPSLYSFPISISSETALSSIAGPAVFKINGAIKKHLKFEAGIEVHSQIFTVEPGLTVDGHSPRMIISINDLFKFINSELWLDGYMHLGQAKTVFDTVRAPSKFDVLYPNHRETMKSQKVQAYKIKDVAEFQSESPRQKEDRFTCNSTHSFDTEYAELNKGLLKIELTGEYKVGVLAYDSMFFDFAQPFLVGLMNMTNKEIYL